MLIAIIVIVGLSLLILGHEAGHFIAAKLFKLRVDEFGIGFPPRAFAWKKGETEYSVNWLPFGGFVKIAGERGEFEMLNPDGHTPAPAGTIAVPAAAAPSRLFYAQPAWKKSVVMLAGVAVNFFLGWLFISLVLMIGAPQALVISDVEANSPATEVGIMAGDVIRDFTTADSFIAFVNANRGSEITLHLNRGGEDIDIAVTPRAVTAANEGAIGIALAEAGTPRHDVFTALRDGFVNAVLVGWLVIKTLYALLVQLFTTATLLPGVVGPVGIFGVAQQTGSIGFIYLLQLMGIISINLAVVNLIPFPALDGGRFVMTMIEKIKGSPLPQKSEAIVNGLGFVFLILLMVLLTVRDVQGLF